MADEKKEAINKKRDTCFWCNGKTVPIFQSSACMICPVCETTKQDKNVKSTDFEMYDPDDYRRRNYIR